jgi:hypothetical protein
MNDQASRPLVGQRFLRVSTVLFILLVPFVVHAAWGYIEVRRLDSGIAAIERAHEPVTDKRYVELKGEAAESDRYYRAAAALMTGAWDQEPKRFAMRLAAAEHDNQWPADLVTDVRSLVASHEQAIEFADRAASLGFDAFAPGTTYSYLTSELLSTARLLGLRAMLRAIDEDADGAASSLHSEARLGRPVERGWASFRIAIDVGLVLGRVRPTVAALARLAQPLADADRDDVVKDELLRMRADLLDGRARSRESLILRPWATHATNASLTAYARMIRVADRPWPERIDAVVDARGRPFPYRDPNWRANVRSLVEFAANQLAMTRAARAVVAIEQHRRDHAEQVPASLERLVPRYLPAVPVDPFSGQSLRLREDGRGYTVYSLGRNRRDDGGQLDPVPGGSGMSALDVGLRIVRR